MSRARRCCVVAVIIAGGLCSAADARTFLLCSRAAGKPARNLVRPPVCSTVGPNESLAEGITIQELRWRSWGGRTARARGIVAPKTNDRRKVRVKLSGRTSAKCRGSYWYTRMRLTGGNLDQTLYFPRGCYHDRAAMPARASAKKCGDASGVSLGIRDIVAERENCNTARQVAKGWEFKSSQGDDPSTVFDRRGRKWSCRVTKEATGTDPGFNPYTHVRCRRQAKRVRFKLSS